jgi:Xaa-Pro aminopeptidase
LFWLTGIEQEGTMLILYPDCYESSYKEILVIVRPNEQKEIWDGKRLRKNEATTISGIENVLYVDNVDAVLQPLIHLADTIYLDSNENDRKASLLATREYRFIKEMQERYPLHKYERAAKLLKNLRSIKLKEEIEVVQTAVNITHKAFERICKFIKPGVFEFEIEAEILHEFYKNRATGMAYHSIIASGDRARTLHYISNNEECKDGELILMDFGAAYGGYCADLTRTIPVNGKFSKRQKEVYNACLHLHNYAKSILKPGISIINYTNKVGEEATKQFIKIGLLSKADVKNEDKSNPAYRKYLYHGISHHLGIDVHDVGTRTEPLQPGMLFTIEPGIYIKEEQMGIRIENNFWITKNGNLDLFKNIPITIEEIEAVMK